MTAKTAWADPFQASGTVAPLPARSGAGVSRETITDWLWILFFFGVASPAHSIGVENSERFFWLLADVAIVLYTIQNANTVFSFAKTHPLLLSWSAIAILSTLWSVAPGISLYHGVQLLMTILVGAMLSLTKTLDQILRILFFALLISLAASLILLMVKPELAFDQNGAFRGILAHKNEFGSRMALLLLTATMLLLHGWKRLLMLASVCFAIAMLIISRSGTSLLLTTAWLAPFTFVMCHRAGYRVLSASLGTAVLAMVLIAGYILLADIDPISPILGSVGKDATLTGRTILWSIAQDAFLERPLLGYGFKGYWENPGESSVIFLRLVIGQELWFFHNIYLEVAVAFGFLGPVLLITTMLGGLGSAVWRYLADRSFITLWSVFYILFVIAFGLAENPLFVNHSVWQLLFVVAVAARPAMALVSDYQAVRQASDADETPFSDGATS